MFVYFNKSLSVKIGLLFLSAAVALIILAYYTFFWSFTETDNILDAHDAYYNYKLIESWGSPPDTLRMKKELKNLQLGGAVFPLDSDTSCVNDTLLYWSNLSHQFNLCNYVSYSDSKDLGDRHNIDFPGYVSFGDYLGENTQYQVAYIAHKNFQYILALNNLALPSSNFNIFPLVFLAFIFMFLLYLIIRRFLSPIQKIERRIRALEGGDFSSKIKGPFNNDELGSLSQNLNDLIEEIRKLLNQKERLLSDVSHELRTPLAKIRLLLEMIPKHKKIEEVNKQIKIIDSLITNILLSDKMSVPYSNLNLIKLPIVDLIDEAIEMSFVKDVIFDYGINKETLVNVDNIKLAVAIKNLLENAHQYSTNSHDQININIKLQNKFILISVIDQGPGIPKNIINNITKAFVRGDEKPGSGFGLGLSICKKVVEAHGGELKIKNNVNGGATFTLCFPQ